MNNSNKIYYTASEIASLLGFNISKIRFWTQEFKEIKPTYSPTGAIRYRDQDIDTFKLICFLVETEGYTLEGARRQLKKRRQSQQKRLDIKRDIVEVRDILKSIKEEIER